MHPPKRQSENMQDFEKSAEQSLTETIQQGDVMTMRETTSQDKRVLQLPLFTPHADSRSTFEISAHSTDRHAKSVSKTSTCATALFPILLTLATCFVTQVLQIHLHAFIILLQGCYWRQCIWLRNWITYVSF